MDNTYLKDAASAAFGQIIGHQLFYLTRVEGMEIQDAVDGQFDGFKGDIFVHCSPPPRPPPSRGRGCCYKPNFPARSLKSLALKSKAGSGVRSGVRLPPNSCGRVTKA